MPDVPYPQRASLRRIAAHGGVMLQHNIDWDSPRFSLMDGGGFVESTTIRSAIANGWLIAQHDGLFAETSQTFRVRDGLDLSKKPPRVKKGRKKKAEAVAA